MLILRNEDKLFSLLERIAFALEQREGIENFPSDISKEKSSPLMMFDPNLQSKSNDPTNEDREVIEREMEKHGEGFFFAEDAVSQEILDKL